jgi:hypothetical protein
MSLFLKQYKGNFKSTLRWPDLAAFWKVLHATNTGQWYIYSVGEEPPTEPASINILEKFISATDELLHKEHDEDYCGIVYADNLQAPKLIKIYDPNNLGVVCGFSDNPPLPAWVLSLTPPEDLPLAFPPPDNRRRWWQKILGNAVH